MLYQNEEPLVQRTCIKTANLQADTNTSDKLETQALPPDGVRAKSLPPEELKLQTLICGHQVRPCRTRVSYPSVNSRICGSRWWDISRGPSMSCAMMRHK